MLHFDAVKISLTKRQEPEVVDVNSRIVVKSNTSLLGEKIIFKFFEIDLSRLLASARQPEHDE